MQTKKPYTPINLYNCLEKILVSYLDRMKVFAYILQRIYFELENGRRTKVCPSKEQKDKIDKAIEKTRDIFMEQVVLKRTKKDVPSQKHSLSYKPISWGQLMHSVRNNLDALEVTDIDLLTDCRVTMATRLYMFGMGKASATREEIATLFRLIEHTVSNDESIVNILETQNEIYELDTPKGINKLASHIVELCLSGMIRSDTALDTLELLEKKIMFSETAHVLPNFERMKGLTKAGHSSSSDT